MGWSVLLASQWLTVQLHSMANRLVVGPNRVGAAGAAGYVGQSLSRRPDPRRIHQIHQKS